MGFGTISGGGGGGAGMPGPPGPPGPPAHVGDTPPTAPKQGEFWFHTGTEFKLYIWVETPTSSQWVGV